MDNQKRFISIIEKNMEAGNYTEAYRLLCDWKERGEKDDILCLLEAEVCRQLGCYDQILPALCRGIAYNSNNYEIYYMMGTIIKRTEICSALTFATYIVHLFAIKRRTQLYYLIS